MLSLGSYIFKISGGVEIFFATANLGEALVELLLMESSTLFAVWILSTARLYFVTFARAGEQKEAANA